VAYKSLVGWWKSPKEVMKPEEETGGQEEMEKIKEREVGEVV
jgi:hypothetical protein